MGDIRCAMLSTLENLTNLNLSQNEKFTKYGAAALAVLSNLKILILGLIHFSDLTKLQSLVLYGCWDMKESRWLLDQLQNGLSGLKCIRINSKGSGINPNWDHTQDK